MKDMKEKEFEETSSKEKKNEESSTEKVEVVRNSEKSENKNFSKKDVEEGKLMAILSYIIPLIPYLVEKKNKFVVFHAKQGMNLLIFAILGSVGLGVLNVIFALTILLIIFIPIINIVFGASITILCIMGIVNVCNGNTKELPIINRFKIIK